MTHKELLKQHIEQAFAEVPTPPSNNIAPHPCSECDEITQHFKDHSVESLDPAILDRHVWDLPLFSQEAKHYFITAWLKRSIDEINSDFTEALIINFASNHRNAGYSAKQKCAIANYIEWVALNYDELFDDAATALGYWNN
ncbi:MAG: hypothetical protein HWD86_05650 [Kangiellaceae bacterium]|nr:hypothetical protein [Kangiellaceae bacterium]